MRRDEGGDAGRIDLGIRLTSVRIQLTNIALEDQPEEAEHLLRAERDLPVLLT